MKDLYFEVLKEELIPALGCTEPIAIAYAAAKARELLGSEPDRIVAECSGNVIKNVKGVIVPMTGNMRGIETSAILGAVAGNASKRLEVLSEVKTKHIEQTRVMLSEKICRVKLAENVENLFIKITVYKDMESASVTIADDHINIVEMAKNEEIIYHKRDRQKAKLKDTDLSFMTVRGIYDYITGVDVSVFEALLEDQIQLNKKIAEEGLTNDYGANVGRTLIKRYGKQVECLAKAYPSAGSDARMSGCVLPVIINSGSGNQGLAASLPVIVYAEELKVSKEKLYRALALSNLIAIYIKRQIGRLSAFCGAVSAACGSGAGIAYLNSESFEVIAKTVVNTLANTTGIICDGAKPSCAAKIASAVDAAIMAYHLAEEGSTFNPGEGLVKEDVDSTIRGICRVAREGMKTTDLEILKTMIED